MNPSEKNMLDNELVKLPDQFIKFLDQKDIDGARFSKSYPYQLLMYETGPRPQVHYTFTLPIPPQSLSINMPFATTVQATLGGIVEQHGGVPFKDISFSGTTGITPIKNNAGTKSAFDSFSDNPLVRTGEALFAGTASAVSRLATSGKSLLGIHNSNVNDGLTNDVSSQDRIISKSTGYSQFKMLERFLESYALLKEKSLRGIDYNGKHIGDTKNLRLAFVIWKDETAYFCSGVNFSLKRNAQSSPMEYMYSLQLKAWKRVPLSLFVDPGSVNVAPSELRGPNYYTQFLNKVYEARDVLDNLDQLIESSVLDPSNRLKEIVRVTGLFLNSSYTISDLPNTLQLSLSDSLVQNWNNLTKQYSALVGKPVPSVLIAGRNKMLGSGLHYASSPSPQVPHQAVAANSYTQKDIQDIFNLVKPNSLPLSLALQAQIVSEKNKADSLTRLDFEKMRDEINEFSSNLSDAVGAGGSTYNRIYNRTQSIPTKTPTDQDYQILFALNNMSLVLCHLAAEAKSNQKPLSTMEYVAGLAQKSGIAFRIPKSKFPVPFPYGFTLEKLAEIYLKDANRWHEIAVLNGLRSPYVDEVGFSLPFQTNGADNKVYVTDASKLYINQTVYVLSNKVLRNKRHIIDIKQIYPNYISIALDGDSDMSNYKTVDSACLEAFLPNTINSQQVIYLPSDQDPANQSESAAIPGVDQFDPLLQISGIDLLLKEDGDLAITPDGDCKMAFGLQNIVQTVKIALATPQGALIQHPDFGFDIPVGSSTADIDANTILQSAKKFFNNDPAFEGVTSASVQKQGPAAIITLVLKVKGLSQYVPITLRLTR